MKTPKTCLIAFVFLLFYLIPPSLHAQQLKFVDGDQIKSIISVIASDEFQGRATGTPGGVMAEAYFANEFKKLKLVPVGDSNTYFHHYTIPNQLAGATPQLIIENRTFYHGYNEDFSLAYLSDSGSAKGEIVFAGYGIVNPEKNRNDFESIDVKDKIVLIKRGAPGYDIAGWRPSCIDSVKAEYCFKHGALGVLFFEPTSRSSQRILYPSYDNRLASVSILPGFPVFSIDERVVRHILTRSGKSYYRILNTIESQTMSFATGSQCSMSYGKSNNPVIHARNVLGMIPGTDKSLKNEYIFIGGHIDHLGIDGEGNVLNGADDNASGSAVALGIAQAMVKNKVRPKRSIVFVGWTGEEMGLLGSQAWCLDPTVDLKNIVVYFNLDMVGLGDGRLNMPGTEYAPEVYEFIKMNLDSAVLRKINWKNGGLGGSDHNYFLRQGIPAFAGMTSGNHPDYHRAGDDPEKINADILQYTGDFIYQCTEKIANAGETFLSAQRMEENKFKLLTYSLLHLNPSKSYVQELNNKNFRIAFIDFSDMEDTGKPENNFVTLLGAFDNAMKADNNKNRALTVGQAYDAWMSRTALLAAFDPDDIMVDELKFKVLAKTGFRLAIIDSSSMVLRDTAALNRLIRIAPQNGVGLILSDPGYSALDTLLAITQDPCLLYAGISSVFSPGMIRNIKEKEHLVVFQLNSSNGVEPEINRFGLLLELVGENLLMIAPESAAENDFVFYRQFVQRFKEKYPNEVFQYNVLHGNFYNVAVKSLQVN